MKNIFILLLLFTTRLLCKAQLLQPKSVQIELMNGSTKKAVLYGYTDDAIIMNRKTKDTASKKLDTVSYTNIEKIKVGKIKHSNKYTITYSLIGVTVGSIVGETMHKNERKDTNTKQTTTPNNNYINLDNLNFDLSGLLPVCTGIAGGIVGYTIGLARDISKKKYIIHGSEARFKEFVNIYNK